MFSESPCGLADSEIRTSIALDFKSSAAEIGGAAFLLHCLAPFRMSVSCLAIVRQECRTSYIVKMTVSGARDNLLIFAF